MDNYQMGRLALILIIAARYTSASQEIRIHCRHFNIPFCSEIRGRG